MQRFPLAPHYSLKGKSQHPSEQSPHGISRPHSRNYRALVGVPRLVPGEILMEKHELTQLEGDIQALKTTHASLASGDSLDELLTIIHRPGWTTPAELAFVRTGLESIRMQTAQLNALTRGLLGAAKLVGAGRAAGA